MKRNILITNLIMGMSIGILVPTILFTLTSCSEDKNSSTNDTIPDENIPTNLNYNPSDYARSLIPPSLFLKIHNNFNLVINTEIRHIKLHYQINDIYNLEHSLSLENNIFSIYYKYNFLLDSISFRNEQTIKINLNKDSKNILTILSYGQDKLVYNINNEDLSLLLSFISNSGYFHTYTPYIINQNTTNTIFYEKYKDKFYKIFNNIFTNIFYLKYDEKYDVYKYFEIKNFEINNNTLSFAYKNIRIYSTHQDKDIYYYSFTKNELNNNWILSYSQHQYINYYYGNQNEKIIFSDKKIVSNDSVYIFLNEIYLNSNILDYEKIK